MTITLSSAASAAVNQMFAALDGILQKGAAFAKAKNIDEDVLINSRLAPDMFPLSFQIRVATELPARALSRLAGADLPSFSDNETTLAEFRDRIVKARAHIKGLAADAIDADPDKVQEFPLGQDRKITLSRTAYVQNFILPNLYFHVTAAYLILRHLGVELGKEDFLAALEE